MAEDRRLIASLENEAGQTFALWINEDPDPPEDIFILDLNGIEIQMTPDELCFIDALFDHAKRTAFLDMARKIQEL
jgi:hypothetical protein